MSMIQEIREKLRLTFGSQHKDDFQQGRIALANEIADILDRADVEDDPIPADPRFPDRPTHPDFARLSSAIQEQDAVADMLGLNEAMQVDEASLLYMANGRIDAVLSAVLSVLPNMRATILALYSDAFHLGVGFTERGGHRPTETGTTGEKEGSL